MPIRPLNPLLAAKARQELNEDPSKIEEHVRNFKQWIAKQPHLNARTDDQWLVAFLRGCKYNVEKAQIKFDLYYTLKVTAPEVFCLQYSDPKILKIIETGAVLIMPKTASPADPKVVMLRLGQYKASDFTLMEIMAVMNYQLTISFLEDDNLTVAGMVSVVDMQGASMGLIRQASLWQIRQLIRVTQEAAPTRVKGIHILSIPFIFQQLTNIVKKFLSEKIRNRFNIYNKNLDDLYRHVPKECLPEEYGGDGGSLREIIDYWKAKMIKYHSWFEEDTKYICDESKRPGKTKCDINNID